MKPRTAMPRKNPRPPSAAVAPGGMSERALDKLTDVFKSLADKNRLKILQILSGAGEMHVSALCQHLSQSQPAVSHHLTQLRHAGLVDFSREGKFNHYYISSDAVEALLAQFFPNASRAQQVVRFGDLEVSFRTK